MRFEVDYDADGKPDYVRTDDGFCQTGRPFNPDTDGWMLEQVKPGRYLSVQMAREILDMADEINALRRELWLAKRGERMWRDASLGGQS